MEGERKGCERKGERVQDRKDDNDVERSDTHTHTDHLVLDDRRVIILVG